MLAASLIVMSAILVCEGAWRGAERHRLGQFGGASATLMVCMLACRCMGQRARGWLGQAQANWARVEVT